MTKEEFRQKLGDNGLEGWFDKLEPGFRSTIRLYLTTNKVDDIPVGQSKFGGCPDLPIDVAWATETGMEGGKSLAFVAQINLGEVTPYDTENLLPDSGMLYFFYAAEQEEWGFDFADKNKFKVIYFSGGCGELVKTEFPADLPDDARFKPSAVTFREEISLPSVMDDADGMYEGLSDQDEEALFDILDEGNVNKLLGYADNIQHEMELECELVTNGLYCGDLSVYDDPRAKELEPNEKDWRLLLQVDSNEKCGMMWGDLGRLYFWIKKDDLLNKRFEKAWFILQCY